MLKKIYIRNIVLINEMEISLSNGLHVFTGETGAGKSILLEGLGLALGARANFSLIVFIPAPENIAVPPLCRTNKTAIFSQGTQFFLGP